MLANVKRMVLGDLPEFAADPLAYVESRMLGRAEPFPARFAHQQVYFVARPGAVRHVLVDAASNYGKGSHQARLRPLFGDGLITASGARWAKARAAAKPGISGSGLDRGIGLALEVLAREIAIQAGQAGKIVAAHEWAGRLTLRMATAALFHCDLDDDGADLAYQAASIAHRRLSEAMWRLIDLDSFLPTSEQRRYQQAIHDLEAIAAEIALQPRGVLSGMAPLASEFGPDVLRDEIITMLVAGFETTAQVTAWLLYVLASRPDLINWIREEIDSHLGRGGDLTASIIRDLPRARALVDEVLRLYPSTWWFARQALGDDVIDGVRIAAGSPIFICPWVLHRQPDLWEHPFELLPERFLGRSPEKFCFIPFGIGARACVGMHLARSEMVAIAALASAAFDIAPASGDIRGLRPVGGVTLAPPASGLRIAFAPRKTEERRAA